MQNIDDERLIGYVKWFNDKKGFGFITVCSEGKYKGHDIFVHHTSLDAAPCIYTYLVQYEYVEFFLCKVTNNNHTIQACNVTGVNYGYTMCQHQKSKSLAKQSIE